MQFGQTNSHSYGGAFCPFRGWTDEYQRHRDNNPRYDLSIAPFEHANYREWNGQ